MRKFNEHHARLMKANELASLECMAQEDIFNEETAEAPDAARVAVAQAEVNRCKMDLRAISTEQREALN